MSREHQPKPQKIIDIRTLVEPKRKSHEKKLVAVKLARHGTIVFPPLPTPLEAVREMEAAKEANAYLEEAFRHGEGNKKKKEKQPRRERRVTRKHNRKFSDALKAFGPINTHLEELPCCEGSRFDPISVSKIRR